MCYIVFMLLKWNFRNPVRGVYFLSTLVISVLIGMLVIAAVFLSRGSLQASEHLTDGNEALKAAESGLRYAQSKLSANPSWRGDDNGVTVQQEGLVVEEDNGNVVGIIKINGDSYSQFRIRFNWQDDAGDDADGLVDPAGRNHLDIPYVSVTNARGGSPLPVPRADGPDFSVTEDSSSPYDVPAGTVCVIVEGRSGPGLSQLDDKNLNPGEVNAAVTTRVLEAYLRVAKLPAANAAAMAAGDLLAELPDEGDKKSQVLVGSATGVPRVRSKGEVTVEGGNADDNYVSPDGEVYSRDGTLNAAPTSRDTIRTDTEDPNAAFYKLSWEDVRKSTSADTNVDAGTYVVWDDGSLHYYDMNLPEYKAFIESDPTNPGTTVTLDSDAMKYDKKKLTIKQNVFVSSTGNSDEFNLIPRGGAQVTPDDEGGAVGPIPIDELEQAVKRASSLPYTVSSPDNMGAYLDFPTADLSIVPPGSPLIIGSGTFELQFYTKPGGEATLKVYDSNRLFRTGPALNAPPDFAKIIATTVTDPDFIAANPSAPLVMSQILGSLGAGGGSPGGTGKIDLPPTVDADLTPDNLEIKFEPPKGESAILSADGSINLGSKVTGVGGSITSQRDIRLVGAGSSLEANVEDGLNLYAKGDILLSSLLPKGADKYEYKSFNMKGVIYAWGDFDARIGMEHEDVTKWGSFGLQGSLVAYGAKNQPELGDPGDGDGGDIRIKAKSVNLTFDPAYLSAFTNEVEPGPFMQTLFNVH